MYVNDLSSYWLDLKKRHEELVIHYKKVHALENLIGWHNYYASYCQRKADILNGEVESDERVKKEDEIMSKRKFYPELFKKDIR